MEREESVEWCIIEGLYIWKDEVLEGIALRICCSCLWV
jgi:hypothetical protein